MADYRANLTPEERQAQNEKVAAATAERRANMTREERQDANVQNAQAKAEHRANRTPEERQAENDEMHKQWLHKGTHRNRI